MTFPKCSIVLFMVSVWLWLCTAAQSQIVSQESLTTLLAQSWRPELSKPTPHSEIESSFVRVAELALSGEFDTAEDELTNIEHNTLSPRYILLCALYKKQIHHLKYSLPGGGGWFLGDIELSRLKEHFTDDDLDGIISVASSSITDPRDQLDANYAVRLQQLLTECDLGSANLKFARVLDSRASVNMPHADLSTLQSHCDISSEHWPENIFSSLDRDFISVALTASLDLSAGSEAAAMAELEHGISAARAAGRDSAVTYFLLALGDALASPNGSVLTLGYDLATDSTSRLVTQYSPLSTRAPGMATYANLKSAEQKYLEAEDIANKTSINRPKSFEFAIRRAYLAYSRQETTASALYRKASVLAVQEHATQAAAISTVVLSLIETSPALWAVAAGSQLSHRDIGGLVGSAELVHTFALHKALGGRLDLSSAELRFASTSSELSSIHHTQADLQDELARIYAYQSRADLAIATSIDGFKNRSVFIEEASHVSHPDQSLIEGEKSSQGVELTFLVGEFTLRSYVEDDAVWNEQKDKYSDIWSKLGVKLLPEGQQFSSHDFPTMLRKGSILSAEQKWFSTALNCDAFLTRYSDFENASVEIADPTFLLQVQLPAALCDSNKMRKLKIAVSKLSPVLDLTHASQNYELSDLQRQRLLLDAESNMQTAFFLADKTEQFELLLGWSVALEELIGRAPELRGLPITAFGFKVHSLIGMGEAAEAIKLVSPLLKNTLQWNQLQGETRLLLLQDLVRAKDQIGDTESSLAALEALKLEEDREQALRSGVRVEEKETSELAMLRRKYIEQPSVDISERLQSLIDIQEPSLSDFNSTQLPSTSAVRSSLHDFPGGYVFLAYSIWDEVISIHRVAAGEGVTSQQSPCLLSDVRRAAWQLRKNLANHRDDWPTFARYLHDCLMPDSLNIPSKSTLMVSFSGELFGIPIEILLDANHASIVGQHAVIYTRFLLHYQPVDNKLARRVNQSTSLVVGVNGTTLLRAEDEATQVSKILHTQPLLGDRANAQRIYDGLDEAKIIHLTTHAFIDTSNPYLSYVALANGQRIEAWRVFQHTLTADLVFLSACDTTSSKGSSQFDFATSNAAAGFAAFFQNNGSAWMIASLWEADDKYTEPVVLDFYRSLASGQTNPAIALRDAKLRAADQPESSHPYFYAPLILSTRDATTIFRKLEVQ